jgi:hypothetical protein
VQLSLENDQGKRGPYIVNITVVNTPPKFEGKDEMNMLDEIIVRLNEEGVMNLPDIENLENQTITWSFCDNKTCNS